MEREFFDRERATFWRAKREQAARTERLDQCTYCGDLYERGTTHHCRSK